MKTLILVIAFVLSASTLDTRASLTSSNDYCFTDTCVGCIDDCLASINAR